jgi:hypothetical protein
VFNLTNPQMGQMPPQGAQGFSQGPMMQALQGFRDARQDWRGQRPMGDPSAMQDWRQQRPQLMNYLNPGSMAPNGQFPVNLQGMHGVGVATPGGGMTGAPLQPQMVGSSMNVQGMIQPTSPYGLPTY